MAPLRIMHISTRLILGGSQENTVLSCEGQVARGHAVALVFGPIYGPEGSLLARVRRFRADRQPSSTSAAPRAAGEGEIEVIETPNLIREINPLRDLRCYGDLRRVIRRWKPDIVHTHSSKAGILGRFAAWRERVPRIIHTVHGPPFHRYETWWRNRLYIAAERAAAKRCHVIVCVADAMREQFLAAGIGRPEQYVTVHSGMELQPYLHPPCSREEAREALGLDQSHIVLGTVARLAELKGHDDLLEALAPLLWDDSRIRLLWVGDGWWRDRLMTRVKKMDLERQVITTGLVPPEDIPRLLQAMDILIHPSYREGLPRTVTQALLSTTPVIAYDVDGTSEVCIDGDTGRLVSPGDPDSLRGAVRWMIDHPREAGEMAQRGRNMCAERFGAERMVDALERVYRGP